MQEKVIYIRSTVAKKLGTELSSYQQTLQTFIENPQHHSLNLEKLHGHGSQPLYSIRHNLKSRIVLCLLRTSQGAQSWGVTHVLENHEYHKLKQPFSIDLDSQAIASSIFANEGLGKEEVPTVKLTVASEVEYVNQQFIFLDKEQQALKTTPLPLIISGAPGSGKTSALLTIIKHNIMPLIESTEYNVEPLRILIIAKSERLVKQMRKEWSQMCKMEFKDLTINPNWVTFQTPKDLYNMNNAGQAVTFRSEPEFISWYHQYAFTYNKLQRDKNTLLPVDLDSIVSIYQELHTMSGYTSLSAYTDQVTDKLSLFTNPVFRNVLWQVYKDYCTHLEKQQSVDLAFEPITLNQQYTLVGVDETQDLSRLQLRSLVQSQSGIQMNVIFCVGDHQRLFGSETTLPFIRSLYWESVHKDITTHKVLRATYRCAESIVHVANASLQLKYHAIGGSRVVDKNELAYIKPNELEKNTGQVRWIEDSETLASVIKTNKDNAGFVVITSPEYIDQAIALFGQERVFTAKQMKGLQAKEVLLYHFFEQAGFRAASKDLPKDLVLEQDAQTITKESQGSVRHSTLFNELFVACTRAESTLIFISLICMLFKM